MFFKLKSYLKFLLKSTNQHGVHSPFVFDYVTKCLYVKKQLHHKKSIDVLLKSIAYFNFRSIQILDNPQLQSKIKEIYPELAWDSDKVDILHITELSIKTFHQLFSEGKIHNNSMIMVDGIHKNQEKEKLWGQLVQSPIITVSIDLFHCGVFFIRKEQVKEHFTIRI